MTNEKEYRMSVVLTVHDQAEALEQQLPLFLSMECGVAYEVIVVDDASIDETPDVLSRMKAEYANLYTTFLPATGHNPSRQRLALTLGVKAAHSDCIVLADIQRPPVSAAWMEGLLVSDAAVVLVYSSRRAGQGVYHQPFYHYEEARRLIVKGERSSGHGHRGRWMKLQRGLYDAVAVNRRHAFDVVRWFDLPVGGFQLMSLRMHTLLKHLFTTPSWH